MVILFSDDTVSPDIILSYGLFYAKPRTDKNDYVHTIVTAHPRSRDTRVDIHYTVCGRVCIMQHVGHMVRPTSTCY